MVGQFDGTSQNRVFCYEVTGLHQNESSNYEVRKSGNVMIKVPFNRMFEEMRRINMMGGTIVNVSAG